MIFIEAGYTADGKEGEMRCEISGKSDHLVEALMVLLLANQGRLRDLVREAIEKVAYFEKEHPGEAMKAINAKEVSEEEFYKK